MVRLLVVDVCEHVSKAWLGVVVSQYARGINPDEVLQDGSSYECDECDQTNTVTSIDAPGLRDTLDDVLPSVASEYVDARLNDDPEEADRTGENMRTLRALAAALGETEPA